MYFIYKYLNMITTITSWSWWGHTIYNNSKDLKFYPNPLFNSSSHLRNIWDIHMYIPNNSNTYTELTLSAISWIRLSAGKIGPSWWCHDCLLFRIYQHLLVLLQSSVSQLTSTNKVHVLLLHNYEEIMWKNLNLYVYYPIHIHIYKVIYIYTCTCIYNYIAFSVWLKCSLPLYNC